MDAELAAGPAVEPVLVVDDLSVEYRRHGDWVPVVDSFSLRLDPGRTLGLVGESGCGKSTTGLAVMDLLPRGRSRITSGSVVVDGTDLYAQSGKVRRQMRGGTMAMIFQEPMSSFDPAFTIGEQIAESVRLHLGLSRREAFARAVEMLELVEIPRAAQRARDYPHTFSGGMLQRAMIASALSCRPRLLVADEPTTALDVTIQSQVLDLLRRLQHELGMAMLFITHDLAVMSDVCDETVVMYAGQAVETGPATAVLEGARHPYSRALIDSMPQFVEGRGRLRVIPGPVPSPDDMPTGCRFAPRCDYRVAACVDDPPALTSTQAGRADRCLRADELFGSAS